jgi:hypothetical protein
MVLEAVEATRPARSLPIACHSLQLACRDAAVTGELPSHSFPQLPHWADEAAAHVPVRGQHQRRGGLIGHNWLEGARVA